MMTDKEPDKILGIRVSLDGTTTIGNLSPDAPGNEKITLTKDQTRILAEMRDARFNEGDGG